MTFSIASRRLVTLVASISLAALLAACASQAEKDAASPVEKLYAEAMDDAESANYDRAIKSLDRIEGKAAGSILAQQAQLELAYLYWKTADKVQALATIDRYIKLHPSSPALDYALYLRGIINFND
ncbi:MAG: outer membrane protein assembly factor BamD, partial [Caulobacter sp.]|nr:outer membrane protein assembly factor BamD [Vitreoscilla sp.]